MSKKSSLNDMKSFLLAVQSNEGLLGFEVFSGLVDHGIFADRLPPCFISKGLSDKIPQDMIDLVYDDEKANKKINKYRRNYIQYQSLRDVNIPRDIGIPHPEAYIAQALSIKRYWNEILEHCNRPSPTFRRVYVRRLRSGAVFEMNYKGVERFESEENKILWEASALYIVKADIKACFPSVYTHSIPWALHGKQKAKGNRRLGGLYGNLIDKCTQNTKGGQTNGVIIGPHTSNIISEIVLTSVDLELQKKGYS